MARANEIDGAQGSRNLKRTSAIFRFVDRLGSASPREVRRGLDLPKTTAFRHLDRLTKASIICRISKTAAVRYQLAVQQPIASS